MPEHVLDLDDIERGIRAGYVLAGEAALAMVNEIRRLHVAVGQQTLQVKRKQNRISTLDHRLRKARAARDAGTLEAARLTEALEAIDDALDCAGHTPTTVPPGGGIPERISFDGLCFEAWPDDPDEWCAGCVAHIALIPPAASS